MTQYSARTLDGYNELLQTVLAGNFAVNIAADRKNLTIVLESDGDPAEMARIAESCEGIDGVTVTIEGGQSVLSEILHAQESIDKSSEEMTVLRCQIDAANKDRDRYRKWYHEMCDEAGRVKGQVKAIATLVNSIFPD